MTRKTSPSGRILQLVERLKDQGRTDGYVDATDASIIDKWVQTPNMAKLFLPEGTTVEKDSATAWTINGVTLYQHGAQERRT